MSVDRLDALADPAQAGRRLRLISALRSEQGSAVAGNQLRKLSDGVGQHAAGSPQPPVVGRLIGQSRKEVSESPPGNAQPPALGIDAEQDLEGRQAHEL
jgi:hypothetical protein